MSEVTYQMIIYLLTVGVQYTKTLPRKERSSVFSKYFERFHIQTTATPVEE